MKTKIAVLGPLLIVALLLILSACTRSQKSPSAAQIPDTYLRAALLDKDLNLDPSGDWMVGPTDVFNILYDPLYLISSDGSIQPGIAAAQPKVSEDGKTYRIQIKQNVRFHDDPAFPNGKGREVAAQDFIYSVKRIASPKNETGLWSLIEGKIEGLDEYRKALEEGKGNFDDEISGLRAVSSSELEIRLTAPFSQILYILAMPAFSVVPHEAVEKYGDEFKTHPVGTGPFRLKSYEPRRILVERVSGHWRSKNPQEGELPPGIVFTYFDDQWNAFKDGKLDIFSIESRRLRAYLDEKFELKEEMKEAGYGLYALKDAYRGFLIFNYKNPFMKNLHFRKAVAYAIPWKDLIDHEDILSASIIPNTISGFTDLKWEYNPEKAKQELALAGYPGGKGLPELVYRARYPIRLFIGGMVEDALETVGIPVRLELNETEELEEADMGSQGWVLDYPDALSILGIFASSAVPPAGVNYGYFEDPQYDEFLRTASTLEGVARTKHYERMAKFFYDNVIAIPFRQTQVFYGTSPRMMHVFTDPLGYFQWAELTIKPSKP